MIPDIPKYYDAYYIENEENAEFAIPDNCEGAIGISIDAELDGVSHSAIKVFNQISSGLQKLQNVDDELGLDLTKMVHSFVVLEGNKEEGLLKISESTVSGFQNSELKLGQKKWTSLVLFVPKNNEVSKAVIDHADYELTPNSKGKVANYAFFAGIISILAIKKNRISTMSKKIVANEMSYLLKKESIKDLNGNPKCAICSQVSLRNLRASVLTAALNPDKMHKYELMKSRDLQKILLKKINKEGGKLHEVYKSSSLFKLDASKNILPYELYKALIVESDIKQRPKVLNITKAIKTNKKFSIIKKAKEKFFNITHKLFPPAK